MNVYIVKIFQMCTGYSTTVPIQNDSSSVRAEATAEYCCSNKCMLALAVTSGYICESSCAYVLVCLSSCLLTSMHIEPAVPMYS